MAKLVNFQDVGKIAYIISGPRAGLTGTIQKGKNGVYYLRTFDNRTHLVKWRHSLYIIDPDIPEAEGLKHEEVARALCQRHQ